MAEKEYIPTHWVNDSEPDIDAEHLNNMEEGIQGLYKPEFDDSGTVEGITSFPAFLEKVVSKMNPITFYKNFKAGMSFILHAGQLVNNGLCNEPGKYPLDAAFGKNLQDQITQQNSNIQINVDTIEHSESVYSLFKNNLSSESGILRKAKNTVYHFRITGDADSIFGNGHFVAFIMADDVYSVISALILSKWTGDAWSMIFTSYDQTNFTKKLS